ncbi:hypothetical protein [Gemmatimonas sp.]|uniref:hypothetical protein n=1 Tax=Gemmatimonas sp. TaxID=1962908 RepID=UPI00334110EA
MKTPSNDGGPAFPLINDHTHPTTINNGMTLRDYFAGQALAQLIKREIREMRKDQVRMDCFGDDESEEIPFHTSHIASESYALADAMLAARERKEDAP